MVDCLAATGTDDFLPFMVIAAVLLAAGIIGLAIANKKARWSAFAVVPLLLGLTLVGTGAQPVQAADLTTCSSSPSPAASPVTTTTPAPAATPTPTPTPTCEPSIVFSDVPADTDGWGSSSETDASWSVDDSATVSELLAAALDPHPAAQVSVSILIAHDDDSEPVGAVVTFSTSDYTMEFSAEDEEGRVAVPTDLVFDTVDTRYPDTRWFLDSMLVAVPLSYDDGCDTAIATITVDGSFRAS